MTTANQGRRWWLIGFVITCIIAGAISYFASTQPDGLEKVAADKNIEQQATEHPWASGPLADYQLASIDNPWLSGALAGLIGVLVVVAVGYTLTKLLVRKNNTDTEVADVAATESTNSVPTSTATDR